jgi:hypothetical protein
VNSVQTDLRNWVSTQIPGFLKFQAS